MEIWKDCKGYEGKYQVSNYGRVWSVKNQKHLTLQVTEKGYHKVYLRTPGGKTKLEYVHRLVAIAFLDNPENKPQVNHKDENKLNNHLDNLEWCDAKYNSNYGTKNERVRQHRQHYVITIYDKNNNRVGCFEGSREAAKAIGVHQKTILRWIKGEDNSRDGYRVEVTGFVTNNT